MSSPLTIPIHRLNPQPSLLPNSLKLSQRPLLPTNSKHRVVLEGSIQGHRSPRRTTTIRVDLLGNQNPTIPAHRPCHIPQDQDCYWIRIVP